MAKQISKPDKTSLVIDRKKVADAKKILGTRTIAETVDGALDEVIRLAARRRLMDRIRRDGGIGPAPRSCAASASRELARFLADTSAWHWSGRVADRWEALLDDDEIATCTPVALELLCSPAVRSDFASSRATSRRFHGSSVMDGPTGCSPDPGESG